MYHVSHTLEQVLQSYANITPEFTLDQSDANLSKLTRGQLDLVLAEMDRHFEDEDVVFRPLCNDRFICILSRKHPLARKLLKANPDVTDISQHMLWGYRQVLSIPAYLTRAFYSRGHCILPVNENVSNCTVANVNEAYTLVLTGIGYALVPRHLIIPHPDLLFLNWVESSENPFGIYCRKKDAKRQTLVADYIKTAETVYASDEQFSTSFERFL